MTAATLDRLDTDFESIVTLTILAGLPSQAVVGLADWARTTEPDTPMLDVMGRELRDFLDARRDGGSYGNAASPLHGLDRS